MENIGIIHKWCQANRGEGLVIFGHKYIGKRSVREGKGGQKSHYLCDVIYEWPHDYLYRGNVVPSLYNPGSIVKFKNILRNCLQFIFTSFFSTNTSSAQIFLKVVKYSEISDTIQI